MKYIGLFTSIILLLSCASAQDRKQNNSGTLSEGSDHSTMLISGNEASADSDSGMQSNLQELTLFLEGTEKIIPQSLYDILDLPEVDWDSEFDHYSVLEKWTSDSEIIFLAGKTYDCAAVTCTKGFLFYTISNETVRGSEEYQLAIESDPEFHISHDVFVTITDWVREWEENEAGAMDAISEKREENYIYMHYGDSFVCINDLSMDDLRIARNYIFAKYGYAFKSEDLNAYFLNFPWYKPQFKNVDDRLTEQDKKIIKHIQALERGKS